MTKRKAKRNEVWVVEIRNDESDEPRSRFHPCGGNDFGYNKEAAENAAARVQLQHYASATTRVTRYVAVR